MRPARIDRALAKKATMAMTVMTVKMVKMATKAVMTERRDDREIGGQAWRT
jgi:hypothetical protein